MTLLMSDPVPSQTFDHIPVMCEEVVSALSFSGPALVVDGTLGLGGHSEALLKHYPQMTVVGVEWDARALAVARERLASWGPRFRGIEGSYAKLPSLLSELGSLSVNGILLDLGLSSRQLNDPLRGFSFLRHGSLDMRMSDTVRRTAWDILQSTSDEELADIFRTYGEERHAYRIAQALKKALILGQLSNDAWIVADCIRRAAGYIPGRLDPATRCFQALRIAVNGELDNVDHFLKSLPTLLASGGRAVILSYHSLEDRRVKTAFHKAAKGCECPPQSPQCVCGKKPWARLPHRGALQPSESEVAANSRSRSAKFRVLEKL